MMVYLSHKARKVFQSSVISATINNNRDLDAFKRCLFEILLFLGAKEPSDLKVAISKFFDDWTNDQIQKSDQCLTRIYSLLENSSKEIQEKDVHHVVKTYETDFDFVEQDITNFR